MNTTKETTTAVGRTTRQRVVPLLVLTLVAAIGLGFAAGIIVAPPRTPTPLTTPGAISSSPVVVQEYGDARTVTLNVMSNPSPPLMATTPGLVTASSCAPGMTVKSGQSMLSVDGQPLLALATSVPLWRELPVQSTGKDAEAVINALKDLGADIQGKTITTSVITAYHSRLKAIGASTASVTSIDPDTILWLPAREVTIASCEVSVGTELAGRSTIATVPAQANYADIKDLPRDGADGARQVIIDGVTLPIDDEGHITDAETLATLSSLPAFAQASMDSSPATLTATWELVDTATVWMIPPSSISAGSPTLGCVIGDGNPINIRIIGSQLGQSFVVPIEDTAPPAEVSLDPAKLSQCG
ncbi:MAG: hypothetical protein FWG15_05150 [Propionibacteriaceae bacterium]|nr:hypothetical protein [Propionibacteriaceae bacterium]